MFATHAKRPKNKMARVANPLGGLLVCSVCGRRLQYKGDVNRRCGVLYCPTKHCPTCGTTRDVVESVVLDGLRAWVEKYEARGDAPAPAPSADVSASAAARAQLEDQLKTLEAQSGRLFDLLEQGVYTVPVYKERRADLDARISAAKASLAALDAPPRPDPVALIIPQVRSVLGAYSLSASAEDKNALLRSVIDHITYTKTQRCYRNNALTDHLNLTIYPRVPTSDIDGAF